MTEQEKLNELRQITESEEDAVVLLSYLNQAKDVILNRMYPYGTDEQYAQMDVPKRFEYKQIRIAAYFMNKRGAEGETQHIENGIHRNYKSSDVPEDMLWDVFPSVDVPR